MLGYHRVQINKKKNVTEDKLKQSANPVRAHQTYQTPYPLGWHLMGKLQGQVHVFSDNLTIIHV